MKKIRKKINFIIALSIVVSLFTMPQTAGAEPINVKTPQDAVVVIDADAADTIETLKAKIEERTGIDRTKQVLIFKSDEIDSSKTVSEYDIINSGSPVYIRLINAVSATVSDAETKSSVGKDFESNPEFTVKLFGGTFDTAAIDAAQNFNSWFTNLPDGLTVVKTGIEADKIKLKFEGKPNVQSQEAFKIVIPKEFITGATENVSVIENPAAKWNITKGISKLNITAVIAADGTVEPASFTAKTEQGETVDNSKLTYKVEYEGTDSTVYARSETKPTAPGKYKIYITASGEDYEGSAEYTLNIKSDTVKRLAGLDLTLTDVSYSDLFGQTKSFNPAAENAQSSEGWSWDYETKKLTLNGADIDAGTASAAVLLPDGATVYIESDSKITAGTDGTVSYALHGIGTLYIDGDVNASLTAETDSGSSCYGIGAENLEIKGGIIKASAGNAGGVSCAIYAAGRIEIGSSKVTAESTNTTEGGTSIGIESSGGAVIIGDGADVQAKGNNYAVKAAAGITAANHSISNADKFEIIKDGVSTVSDKFESGNTYSITNQENKYVSIRNGYRINLNGNIANGTAEISGGKNYADAGDSVVIITTPADGYKQGSISVTDSNGKPVGIMNNKFTMPASDVTVNVTFADKSNRSHIRYSTVTIKFDTNGGETMSDMTVTRNQYIGSLKTPVRDGYVFDGWYLDKACTKEYNPASTVTDSMTLYAGWREDASNQIILTIGDRNAKVWNKTVSNDVAPVIRNDRTMLPARFVAEALGAQVSWSDVKREVTVRGIDKNGESVVMYIYIDSDQAFVNGKAVKLDSPAFIENDRTYTPIRFISEKLGASVEWNEKEQKVIITKN